MKKKTIIAMALIIALFSGCSTDNGSVSVTEQSTSNTTSETVAETTETTTESTTETSAETSGMTMPPVDTDAWTMTAGKKKDHQQIVTFTKGDSKYADKFSIRVIHPETKAKKNPAVVILNYDDPMTGYFFEAYEGCADGIANEGTACIMVEPFGIEESVCGSSCPTLKNINEILTVLFANMDKIPGIDSSKVIFWSNSNVQLFALNAMQDKCDKVSAIFLPGTDFLYDGACIRKDHPDMKEVSSDWYAGEMYYVDAKDLFKKIDTKVYIYTPLVGDPDEEKLCEEYSAYFPDKVWERSGMNSDYNMINIGEGEIFEKAMEDLKTVFGD